MVNDTAVNEVKGKRQRKKYQKKDVYTEYQVYELWWKFLSLSKTYEEFCEIMRSVTDTETEDFYRQVDEGYKTRYPKSEKALDYDFYFNHLSNWEFMGDVHKTSFEDWWKSWKISDKKSYSIINLRDYDIRKKLPRYQFALRMHDMKEKKPPTADEVIKYFTGSKEHIFIAIPLSDELKTEEIRKTISEMRKTATKESANMKALMGSRFRKPYGTIKYDELNNYYKAFVSEKESHEREEARNKAGILDSSIFSKHLNNALAIIENVEKGIFPGTAYWGKSFLKRV